MKYKNKIPNHTPDVHPDISDITPEQNDNMPLISKIEGLEFDIDKLQWCMNNIVLKHDPAWAGTATEKRPKRKYGGWSLTSHTGDIHDGWQSVLGWKDNKFHIDLAYENGYMPRWYHNKKTSLCVDYFAEVIDILEEKGFYPRAVRIWIAPGNGTHIGPHTDQSSNAYAVRLHIPLITNEGCTVNWYAEPSDYSVHLPADGSAYLLRTNIYHDAYNHGITPRYHFIAEVYDTQHMVPGFGYDHIDRLEDRFRREVARFKK